MPLTPNNREEHWLQGMVDGQTTLEPNKRREYWYKEIVDAIGSGGGGGGAFVVHEIEQQDESIVLDKTWREIVDAVSSGRIVLIYTGSEEEESIGAAYFSIAQCDEMGTPQYRVKFFYPDAPGILEGLYGTDTENGYPVYIDTYGDE